MPDFRAKHLIKQGDSLFQKRAPLMSFWQEIADNFYPERADFTVHRALGTDFGAMLTTSFPVLARRSLGELFSSMLRPSDKDWFQISVARDDKLDTAGREWLEWATRVMRRAMYDRNSQFVRATKEADHDYASFGQAVISKELNRDKNGLLFRSWHLRDVAWCENAEGKIDTVHRKWKPTATDLKNTFGADKLHPKVRELLAGDKDPYATINCRHIVVPTDLYEASAPDGKKWRTPFVSVYVDVENEHIIEESGVRTMIYTIPRWQTVSGSQYAYSPCTVAGLADARLIQAMSLVLLESGEKAVNPPLIAQRDAIRGDIAIYAGGLTWSDKEYDERLGDVLRPLSLDFSGMPVGIQLREDVKATIIEAFYLNKINLPPPAKDMTAFEVGQRINEYIRNALPLFEPMESDYNGSVCEDTFSLLMDGGAFGSPYDMPESLRGQEVQFTFESPLHEIADRQLGQTFLEAKAMLAQAADMDQGAVAMFDARTALREVLTGIGVPTKWTKSEEEVAEQEAAIAQEQKTALMLQQMSAGAGVAEQLGNAAESLKGAQV